MSSVETNGLPLKATDRRGKLKSTDSLMLMMTDMDTVLGKPGRCGAFTTGPGKSLALVSKAARNT